MKNIAVHAQTAALQTGLVDHDFLESIGLAIGLAKDGRSVGTAVGENVRFSTMTTSSRDD